MLPGFSLPVPIVITWSPFSRTPPFISKRFDTSIGSLKTTELVPFEIFKL